MPFIQSFTKTFEDIADRIYAIGETENTYPVRSANEITTDIEKYSDHGLISLGKTVGFPAEFVTTVNDTNPALAKEIIADRLFLYFDVAEAARQKRWFYAREFNDKISGCVSNRYAYFDDKQVADVIENSQIAKKHFTDTYITPERLHLRAIDEEPFKVSGDNSDLYFCYFIDNSMVGLSSFKVQFGVYRKACSNGLIIPIKEFTLLKQVHKGTKDICGEFVRNIAFLDERKPDIINMLKDLTTAEASIASIQEEYRQDYLGRALLLSRKEADKVLQLYSTTYGGRTKWDLVNAITEFARDTKNVERREYLERKALSVAGLKLAA